MRLATPQDIDKVMALTEKTFLISMIRVPPGFNNWPKIMPQHRDQGIDFPKEQTLRSFGLATLPSDISILYEEQYNSADRKRAKPPDNPRFSMNKQSLLHQLISNKF